VRRATRSTPLSRWLTHASRLAALLLVLGAAACPGPNPQLADSGTGDWPKGTDLSCVPDNNGEIATSELLFKPGLQATYRVNTPGTLANVDVAGKMENTVLTWDFSATDGQLMTLTVALPGDAWYAKYFSNVSFVLPSDAAGDTLQVYRMEPTRMLLLGIVSKKPDVTRMIYTQPVEIMQFPLKLNQMITSTGKIENGVYNGLPISADDTYEVKIDAIGNLRLPYIMLEKTLRMRVKYTAKAMGATTAQTVYQAQWFHECYGEVVRAVSQKNEPKEDFTQAGEVRRLSF